MGLEQDMQVLARVDLFEGFSNEQLRLLAFGAQRRNLPEGSELFHAGSHADCGYVIAAGEVEIIAQKTGSGDQKPVSHGVGALIGALSLVTRNKRTGTAIARTDVELLRIPRDLFVRMLEEYPDLAVSLRQRFARDITGLVDRLERVKRRLG